MTNDHNVQFASKLQQTEKTQHQKGIGKPSSANTHTHTHVHVKADRRGLNLSCS